MTNQDLVKLLHALHGQLGLAIHRDEGSTRRWKVEAGNLTIHIQQAIKEIEGGKIGAADLLTPEEHEAMEVSGKLAGMLNRICKPPGSEYNYDFEEAVIHIHNIQHMILAQAAARAYPERYRPLGGWLKKEEEPKPDAG